jgi:1,2-dihydroxy-3-keto-5-methylthiopentene dioxygenase
MGAAGGAAEAALDQQSLNDAEKDELLASGKPLRAFEKEKAMSRATWSPHEDVPGIGDMLNKFNKIHYHTDDEVRHILAGRLLRFRRSDGGSFARGRPGTTSTCLRIPTLVRLRDSKRIKAARYSSIPVGAGVHRADMAAFTNQKSNRR